MAENMGRTTARANDTSPVHGLGSDHRDCTVIRESPKRRPGYAAIDTPNGPFAAVSAGDWIAMYATGLGAVNGPVADGEAPGDPPPQVSTAVNVTLGGTPLEVMWAGLAPGFAGLYQINAKLPAEIGSGFVVLALVVSAGGESSNAGMVAVSSK